MIYALIASVLAFGALYGYGKVEHSGKVAAQAQAKAAVDANKSLADDCKAKIGVLTNAAVARAAADAKRSADAAKARKLAAEKAKAAAASLASLQALIDNKQALSSEAECNAMRQIIRDAAK